MNAPHVRSRTTPAVRIQLRVELKVAPPRHAFTWREAGIYREIGQRRQCREDALKAAPSFSTGYQLLMQLLCRALRILECCEKSVDYHYLTHLADRFWNHGDIVNRGRPFPFNFGSMDALLLGTRVPPPSFRGTLLLVASRLSILRKLRQRARRRLAYSRTRANSQALRSSLWREGVGCPG